MFEPLSTNAAAAQRHPPKPKHQEGEGGQDRTPNHVDLHVGARVRTRRKSLNMSQQELADKISLTFQQVQKYERGSNRISASKLYQIAQALGCKIDHFFEGLEELEAGTAPQAEQDVHAFLMTTEGLELAQAFARVPAGKLRRTLLTLVNNLAEDRAPNT